jgi:hypothetical protein
MRENVARIRQLMQEAAPAETYSEMERKIRSDFEYFDLHSPAIPRVESSPRSRAIRIVSRIMTSYGWESEVARWLDMAGAGTLLELDDTQLFGLEYRLIQLEECIQFGMGAPDAPPAT